MLSRSVCTLHRDTGTLAPIHAREKEQLLSSPSPDIIPGPGTLASPFETPALSHPLCFPPPPAAPILAALL